MANNYYGDYRPPVPTLFPQRYFGPPHRNFYGFNQNPRVPMIQRNNSGRNGGWFRGRGHGNREGLKRDCSAIEDPEDHSRMEKIMKTHSNFHLVRKISRKGPKKHRKATQDVKLPPGTVDASLPTFELQALDLISKMVVTDEQKSGVQEVLMDLTSVLKTLIEDIDPIVYGSMSTGLALGTSDVDCFLDSKVLPDGAVRMEKLLKNRSLLLKGKKFDCVVGIPKARVPILKATHVKTGIEVDMNCTSASGIQNSALIRYLVHHDERIRQLIILIQTFYRSCKISGTNKVTSYAVTLLVIFYLQKLPAPILPPLCKILYAEEGQTWPASFERTIPQHIQGPPNQMNLTELFAGYFQFYANFDFTKVISTYLGCELESSFLNAELDKLPAEFATLKSYWQSVEVTERKRGFLDKLIMVQDPIEHYLNTTWNVPKTAFELFVSLNQTYRELMIKKPETLWLVNMMPGTAPNSTPGANIAPSSDLPPVAVQIRTQKFPPVEFNVPYPLEGCEKDWPEHLIPDFSKVFDLLLIDSSVESPAGLISPTIVFNLETHYNVFKTRFSNAHLSFIADPLKYDSVKSQMTAVRDRMKKPDSSFCASLSITRAVSPNELKITVKDRNRNVQNIFPHMTQKLQEDLSKLLAAVKKFRETPRNGGL